MSGSVVGLLGDRVDRVDTWSGSPAGLRRGLTDLGVESVAVDTHLPRALDRAARAGLAVAGRSRPQWERSAAAIAARQAQARWRTRRLRAVAGWIQIGSESGTPLPPKTYVTFDDMTVAQARRLPNPYFDKIDAGTFDRWETVQRRLVRSARAICVASDWAARSFVQDCGAAPSSVHVVGIGANLALRPRPRPWHTPRFLFVGRDWARKNGPGVLRAFGQLRSDLPDARLDLVGAHPPIDAPGVVGHGPLRQDVPAQRDRLARLFESATCLVVPSLSEPFGIVYLEAATAGVASIGTTEGGASEPIGQTGCLVDPTDPGGLLAAMREMSAPEVARERGRAAAARAELFTWTRVAARTVRALGAPACPWDEAYLDRADEPGSAEHPDGPPSTRTGPGDD